MTWNEIEDGMGHEGLAPPRRKPCPSDAASVTERLIEMAESQGNKSLDRVIEYLESRLAGATAEMKNYAPIGGCNYCEASGKADVCKDVLDFARRLRDQHAAREFREIEANG